jgi:hypothetical protein
VASEENEERPAVYYRLGGEEGVPPVFLKNVQIKDLFL